MSITPIPKSTLQGIQYGLQDMRRHASEITSVSTFRSKFPTKDSVRAMVELQSSAHHTTASVKAFKAADEMIGSLLDVKA